MTRLAPIARDLESAGVRMDSNESAFLDRELTFVSAEVVQVLYSILKARDFIPMVGEVPEWADTWTYREYDERGTAALISNYAGDLPLVDAFVTETPHKISDIGAAYQWTIRDLVVAARMEQRLDVTRAQAARNAIERKIDAIAATGIPERGIKGFLNNASVPHGSLPTGTWASATADQILGDMFAAEQAVITNSAENHEPDTMLLTPAAYGIAATKRAATTSDTTVLSYFLANAQSIKNVGRWKKLEGAGAASTNRLVAYKRDPSCVRLVIPVEFKQLEPEKRNLAYIVDCLCRIGGVSVIRPLSMYYGDGT